LQAQGFHRAEEGIGMKAVLFGVSTLGVGGIYLLTGTPGPDFDRSVSKQPMAVYAAFSALGPAGDVTQGPTRDMPHRITRRIEKKPGESLRYEILCDDRPVVNVDVHFAAMPENKGTRITAEIETHPVELGNAFETEAGVALSMVPQGFIDLQFAHLMNDLADDIEAGRPLPPLDLAHAGIRRAGEPTTAAGRRDENEAARRRASAPSLRPTPMIDPDPHHSGWR
jgi:hypothetical protein